MGFEAVNWVLNSARNRDGSRIGASRKLVLLGIASHADKYGDNAWPSLETLADYADLSIDQVRRHLRALESEGVLVTEANGGGTRKTPADRRPNLYRIVMSDPAPVQGRLDERPRADDGHDPAPTTERPRADAGGTVLEPSEEPSDAAKPRRPRFVEFDALMEVWGTPDMTREESAFFAKVARSLKDQGKSPAEIIERGKRARKRHPDCTVNILLTRWSNFAPPHSRGGGTWEDVDARAAAEQSAHLDREGIR